MLGPEACPPADLDVSEPPLEVGSRLCTQCGLCCTGALHNYAVLEPGEIEFAGGLGLTIRTEGKPGFALPCPLLVNSKCSIYRNRPNVCGRYKCQLLENVEAGATDLETAIDRVVTAKQLVAQVDAVMPNGMTLPEARARIKEADTSGQVIDVQLKLATTALSFYLDRYFRNSKEGNLLSLEPVDQEQPTTEMK